MAKKLQKLIKHPSYYGCINELPKDDKRISIFLKQYKERGFDDTETWNLFFVVSSFILPRLKRFREIKGGYPGNLTEKKWNKILDKMILCFDLINQDKISYSDKEEKQIIEGLELFPNWFRHLFRHLWW